MHIHQYERWWIIIFVAVLGVFLASLIIGAVVFGVRVPDTGDLVNPLELENTEFANPGVRDMGDNQYNAYILSQMWAFIPAEIRVPVGAVVDFNITSPDVTHGFMIEHHNVNFMVIPGHVARGRITFDEPGEYRYICHEFCGRGHHLMHGRIIVEDPDSVAEEDADTVVETTQGE